MNGLSSFPTHGLTAQPLVVAQMNSEQGVSLLSLFQQGDWVMYPLLACSIVAVAIVLERLLVGMNRSKVLPQSLAHAVEELLDANKLEDVYRVCAQSETPLSRIVLTGLRNAARPREEIVELLEYAGRREFAQLNRYVGILGTIAAIAPLLGLLGTVVGIIETFSLIQQHGIGNPTVLAGGISQALVATASGIGVAVPSVIFYRYFQLRSRALILELEEYALKILTKVTSAARHAA